MGWERFSTPVPDCHPHEHVVGVLRTDTASESESCRHDLPTRPCFLISPPLRYLFLTRIRSTLKATGRMIVTETLLPQSQSASPCFFNLL